MFVPVTYHAWWPSSSDPYYRYNISENGARVRYYPPHTNGSYYTPYAWVDGIVRGGYTYDSWRNYIVNRASIEAPLEILLDGQYRDGDLSGTLEIKIIAHDPITWQGLRVRIALIEDSCYYQAPNGTLWHNNTMRDMIPDTLGIPLNISQGDTVYIQQDFLTTPLFDVAHCKLVVWVQADIDQREVLQAARIWIYELDPVAIDDVAGLPVTFELAQNYPNPFNAQTKIEYSLAGPSQVTLEIFDILGRKKETLVNEIQQPGVHSVIWDAHGVPSGIYFYRLQAGDFIETLKMNLIK